MVVEAAQLFSIVPNKCDPDVLEVCRLLVHLAETGQILGLAYVALEPGAEYSGDLVGNALKHPVLALGLTKALEEKVASILR